MRPDIDISRINPGTRIVIAEALLSIPNNKIYISLAEKLMAQAYLGKMEESEIKKITVNLRKMGSNERAIDFISDMMTRYPHLQNSFSLFELRAKSNIELAKVCTNTGRDRRASSQIRAKAWDQCRSYLAKAEKDLSVASQYAVSSWDRHYLEDDYQFLQRMKEIAKKPPPKKFPHRKF